ncbi:MAG: ATP-binding protein [Alphaproteobacteria bacterium]|nr:ATP-binding protein [Alphaproteobacteria bacterium]
MTAQDDKSHPENLLEQVTSLDSLNLDSVQESAWVEVINKMEEVYSDLIRYEVDLEGKNAALEDAQRFITSVVESVSDVLIVCDRGFQVLQVNKAMLELTGLPEEELLDCTFADLLVPEDRALFNDIRANAEKRIGAESELRFKALNGETDLVAVHSSTRFDHDGRRAGLVLTGRPIGELRRAYEALNNAHAELQQAQKNLVQQEKMASIGRLVAGVAHELNNPISFVYGNVHTLDKYRDRVAKYLEAIHQGISEEERESLRKELRIDALLNDLTPLIEGTLEGATRVSEIVKNLRRLSFPKHSEPEVFNLTNVINTAVQWAAKGGRRPISIEIDLPEELLVSGQSGQIHQVFVNLVQNALDAISEALNPKMSIVGESDAGSAIVVVKDNGTGMDRSVIDKIFEPFFTTKDVGEGTGLGLWISYGIVKDHGGDIVAGNAKGGGTEFIVTFPAPNSSRPKG